MLSMSASKSQNLKKHLHLRLRQSLCLLQSPIRFLRPFTNLLQRQSL